VGAGSQGPGPWAPGYTDRTMRAAIAIRTHSGWGALIAIAGTPHVPELVSRKRLVIADAAMGGAKQPYHFAANLPFEAAARHIAACTAASEEMAFAGLRDALAELRDCGVEVSGCALLLAAGGRLPPLADILKSHSLIHSAEGEFFREAFRKASERLDVPVTGYRERDLEQRVRGVFGPAADAVIERVAKLGKSVGPPWTADQKRGALAAILLVRGWKSTSAQDV
jgi:hypothetical protein